MSETKSEYRDYLKPGSEVWIQLTQPNGKIQEVGEKGDLVYEGYQVLGTVTFLILSQVSGSGKKSKMKTLSYNATDVRRIGLLSELCA